MHPLQALRQWSSCDTVHHLHGFRLGKTFISALLAQQLSGGKLIICPPVLKEYWDETLFEFGVRKYYVESMGKLDKIADELKINPTKYSTIFIDEAHRFRNEYTNNIFNESK